MEERTLEEILAGIKPVKVRHMVSFIQAAKPLFEALDKPGMDMLDNANHLIDAVVIGAEVDEDWLADQGIDVLGELALKVMEVNVDFFGQRLLPKITALTEKMVSQAVNPGGTSS